MPFVPFLLALCLLLATPAHAASDQVLGIMPSYPGSTRPLRTWETPQLAIALTTDAPEVVLAFYEERLARDGWILAPGARAEARAAAKAGQPAWLKFTRQGVGRLDVQVTRGRHPKTAKMVTVVFYQRQVKP